MTTIPHGNQHRRGRISAASLFILALCLLAACSDKPRDDILAGLPPELARHVAAGDDSTLARYVRNSGYSDLRQAMFALFRQEMTLWTAGRETDAIKARNYARRLATIFAVERNAQYFLRDIEYREGLSGEKFNVWIRARNDLHLLTRNVPAPAQERLDAYNRMLDRFEPLGDTAMEAMCRWIIAFTLRELGRHDDYAATLRDAYEGFTRVRNHYMTCQALGVLGSDYENAGDVDSMVVCYEEALRIAHRSRIGDHAARILTFYSGHYGRQGRLDLQRLLLLRAVDVAREYNSGYRELRYIYEAMRFHADLGCWDVVEDLLMQAHGVKRRGKGKKLQQFEINFLRTDVTEARLKMAHGDVSSAERILDRVLDRLEELDLGHAYRMEDEVICFYRAGGLLENGLAAAAFTATRDALSRPSEESAADWSARLALLMAKAALVLEDIGSAEAALGEFDRFSTGYDRSLRRELTERDALRGSVALARGRSHEALGALVSGLVNLERTAATIDASVGSYLWLAGSDDLRQLMHEMVANDPLVGYGAELYWRELYRTLGGRGPDATALGLKSRDDEAIPGPAELIRSLRAYGQATLNQVSTLGAIHCVYFLCDDGVCRWTASPQGLRKDVLRVSVSDLRALVARAVKMMADHPRDRDSAPDDRLCAVLRDLARALLPAEVFRAAEESAEQPFSFYVTPDGFLGQIPFGAFDIGRNDSYVPLLSQCDVAYLRSTAEVPENSDPGKGIILANSSAETQPDRRFVSRPALRQVWNEARALRDLDPDAVFLSGDSATKRELKSRWETAPYIYMATHTIWDPELPYLTMIPLVVPENEPAPDAAFLDIADIRGADLGGCNLVVLSGCSSGVPYIEQQTMGPSLGDAFLDAGAASVVHTFWDVKDEDASRIGVGFVEGWEKEGASLVRALSEARRAEMRGPNGIRHPSCWASYAIKLSGF